MRTCQNNIYYLSQKPTFISIFNEIKLQPNSLYTMFIFRNNDISNAVPKVRKLIYVTAYNVHQIVRWYFFDIGTFMIELPKFSRFVTLVALI